MAFFTFYKLEKAVVFLYPMIAFIHYVEIFKMLKRFIYTVHISKVLEITLMF